VKLFNRSHVRKSLRYISVCVMLVAAIIAVAIVGSLTIDLGPAARRAAETQASKYIERPVRIGRLSIHVLSGKYVIEDIVIDGLHPGARPVSTSHRGLISVALAAACGGGRISHHVGRLDRLADARGEWENGHNMPRFTRGDQPQGRSA
jgi:hypothetical protein